MAKYTVKEEVVVSMIVSAEKHLKKYGLQKISVAELDALTGFGKPRANR